MSQALTKPAQPGAGANNLERQVRAHIESLSYLPTTAAVAMKFVELGRDQEADPKDYAKIICADSSLSSKILALSNSSWFGVRNKVTNVQAAVNLLGLSTVRSLAISYCMTGLHNELGLTPEESSMFWEASLCKGVAAKHYICMFDKTLADDAFVTGIFQDLALTIMYTAAKEPSLAILQDPGNHSQMQLEKERRLFGLDHAEVGRILAQKLDLPDAIVDAIAFHHDYASLSQLMDNEQVGDAVFAASLFPHSFNAWNRQNADELCKFLDERVEGKGVSTATCMTEIQEDFDQLYRFFHSGAEPEARLAEMLQTAAREAADITTHLVATVHHLMRQAAQTGVQVSEFVQKHDELEDKATRDPLTRLLNREAFTTEAKELTGKAIRYGTSFAVAYLDVDHFKHVNDTLGHEVGDVALQWVAEQMRKVARDNSLIARVGGDEFVLLLYDCSEQEAQERVTQLVSGVAAKAVRKGKRSTNISLSAGCLTVRLTGRPCTLDSVLSTADKLMYQAKQAGGNRVQTRSVRV